MQMRTTDTIALSAMQYVAQCLAMGKALGFNDEVLRLAFAERYSEDKGATTDWYREWQKFYQEVFGLAVDLSDVVIPDEKLGFGWVVMVAKGLTLNQAWAKCSEKFSSYSYLGDDLDKAVSMNDRTAGTTYSKRFRDRVESDEELKNLSANQLAKKRVQSITLLERLLLELWYFWKTVQHLDIQNVTLCARSRRSGGVVPGVCWSDNRLYVCSYSPGSHDGGLRARAAV